MVNSQDHFVWYELITADMPAARTFYASVIGWEMRDASMPGMAYTLCSTARGSVCGLVDVAAEAAPATEKPCWVGYVGVDDVDAAATRAIAHGGVVEVVPQHQSPGVSRFAILTDPQFVLFGVIKMADAAAADCRAGHAGRDRLARVDGARRSGRLRLSITRCSDGRTRETNPVRRGRTSSSPLVEKRSAACSRSRREAAERALAPLLQCRRHRCGGEARGRRPAARFSTGRRQCPAINGPCNAWTRTVRCSR